MKHVGILNVITWYQHLRKNSVHFVSLLFFANFFTKFDPLLSGQWKIFFRTLTQIMFLSYSLLILPWYVSIKSYCGFWNGHSFPCLLATFTSLVLWSVLHPCKTKYFNSKVLTCSMLCNSIKYYIILLNSYTLQKVFSIFKDADPQK